MVWFVILAVLTAGLALGLPPDPATLQQLHISSVAYRVAILLLLVPYGIIWYAAFYAFAKLKEYARAIKGSDDGKAFRSIMIGMGVLAFELMLTTVVSLVLGAVAVHNHGFKPSSVIIDNYLGMAAGIVALVYINNGTHKLSIISKNRPSLGGTRVFALLFITLASIFTYLVISYHAKHTNVYYLDTALLITTFIIPNLFGWFVAILAAYEFWLYGTFVKGSLYRQTLRQFSYGLVVAIAASVAGQFIDNTFAQKVSHSLGSLLLVEYALLIVLATGLILMALGAKKLQKIEEA